MFVRPLYHFVSKLHFPIDVDDEDDDEVVDTVVFRSAPGAALPLNGLVRLFISESETTIRESRPAVPSIVCSRLRTSD